MVERFHQSSWGGRCSVLFKPLAVIYSGRKRDTSSSVSSPTQRQVPAPKARAGGEASNSKPNPTSLHNSPEEADGSVTSSSTCTSPQAKTAAGWGGNKMPSLCSLDRVRSPTCFKVKTSSMPGVHARTNCL